MTSRGLLSLGNNPLVREWRALTEHTSALAFHLLWSCRLPSSLQPCRSSEPPVFVLYRLYVMQCDPFRVGEKCSQSVGAFVVVFRCLFVCFVYLQRFKCGGEVEGRDVSKIFGVCLTGQIQCWGPTYQEVCLILHQSKAFFLFLLLWHLINPRPAIICVLSPVEGVYEHGCAQADFFNDKRTDLRRC